jgi:hypothetical protein
MQILQFVAVPFLNVERLKRMKNAVPHHVLKIATVVHGLNGVTAIQLSLVICNVVKVLSNVSVLAHPLNMEVLLALKTSKNELVFFLAVLSTVLSLPGVNGVNVLRLAVFV